MKDFIYIVLGRKISFLVVEGGRGGGSGECGGFESWKEKERERRRGRVDGYSTMDAFNQIATVQFFEIHCCEFLFLHNVYFGWVREFVWMTTLVQMLVRR